MTQLESAKRGDVSQQVKRVAGREGLDPESVRQAVAKGTVVVPANAKHTRLDPCGIGEGLRTKVNANIGTSSVSGGVDTELRKLRICEEFGADAVMDLSTGGPISVIRRAIVSATALPLGTVPIYEAGIEAVERRGAIVNMTADDLFAAIERQAVDGVDFMTVHCGVTQRSVAQLSRRTRLTNVVSRGGAFLVGWILHQGRENPLYEQFDRLLEIARRYDITLSLGDGMRPGSISDATDGCQIDELLTLAELVQRSREADVLVMVEGP
ncbi:MAG: phosphomethylpyrimidine synthase ThiC, partial [Chloroflexi bacterium]|nr:phosphomethylpyrimidine synthase ThiC [Chloroflexota bacterium]